MQKVDNFDTVASVRIERFTGTTAGFHHETRFRGRWFKPSQRPCRVRPDSTVQSNSRQQSSSAVNNRCGKSDHQTSAGESLGGRGAAGPFDSATDETSKTGLLITRKLPETPGLAWGGNIPLSMPARAKRSAQKDWIEQPEPVSA